MKLRDGYKKTEVGVIPDDWEVKKLSEIGEFKNGINKGKEYFGLGSPFVNLLDVFGVRKLLSNTVLGLVNSSVYERKFYDLKKGDVLFVRSSVKPTGVGLTTVIDDDLKNTVFSGFLIRYRDYGKLHLEYKAYCFYEEEFRKRIIDNSTVSANTNINQNALKKVQIALPPTLKEQTAIATALSDTDALISSLDKLIAKKRNIKQGAMQQLLTGK
ncbi:MAG: restriction endonuclease subunit S, partial [Pseudomonadota bacterium]